MAILERFWWEHSQGPLGIKLGCLLVLFDMMRSPRSCITQSCFGYHQKAFKEEGCSLHRLCFVFPFIEEKTLNFKVFMNQKIIRKLLLLLLLAVATAGTGQRRF